MREIILKWYDEMIRLNEESENYEACSYFKTSKEAYLSFQNEGTILYRGKRYNPEEVLEIVKQEKNTSLKGVKG